MTILKTASNEPFVLPETLDLCAAAPIASHLLEARGNQLRVDASNVRKIGAQCMQVIVSAYLTWERDGLTLTLVNPSKEFVDAFRLAGLDVSKFIEKDAN